MPYIPPPPTPETPWTTTPLKSGAIPSNSYTCVIGSLSANTLYEYRAIMSIGSSTYYGETYQITTLPEVSTLPKVKTGNAGGITAIAMQITGNSVTGGTEIVEYGFLYTSNSSYATETTLIYENYPNVNKKWISGSIGLNVPYFTVGTNIIIHLLPDSTVYYRAFAKNASGGIGYGVIKTADTLPSTPPTTTLRISSTLPETYGDGIINITGGISGEIIDLQIVITEDDGIQYQSLSFTGAIGDGTGIVLDNNLITPRMSVNGHSTLDGSGEATSIFEFNPYNTTAYADVTISGRNSGLPLPTGFDKTTRIIPIANV